MREIICEAVSVFLNEELKSKGKKKVIQLVNISK